MKPLQYWLLNLAADAVMFGSLTAWAATGQPGPLNVFLVLGWLCAGCAIFLGLFAWGVRPPHRPSGATAYQCASHVVFVVASAWFGFFALAATYAIGAMLVEGWRHNAGEVAA